MNLDDLNERLGRAVADARKESGITQGELARLLAKLLDRDDPHGQSSISNWERGMRAMSARQLVAVEIALELNPGELLARAGYRPGWELTTLDRLRTDPDLSVGDREALAATYRVLAARTSQQRATRRQAT